jgi:hypothetical protein
MQEPGVGEALADLLVQAGVLRPDGTPAAPPEAAAAAAPQAGGPAPGTPDAGKLWTPGSETGGGGGKIWTPD